MRDVVEDKSNCNGNLLDHGIIAVEDQPAGLSLKIESADPALLPEVDRPTAVIDERTPDLETNTGPSSLCSDQANEEVVEELSAARFCWASPDAIRWIDRVKTQWKCWPGQEATLEQFYNRHKDGRAALCLISAASGMGKTRLARSLKDAVCQRDGGYFLRGKCDFLRRPEPYPSFVSAFNTFTRSVEARGKEEVQRIRNAVCEAVGDQVSVLTAMIPTLERILGHGNSAKFLAQNQEAVQRFIFVFRMFMRSVSSPEHPVVLLLDDLHFADPCSLDLLSHIVNDGKNTGLVIIGTYDHNHCTPDSYLAMKLQKMERILHGTVQTIQLPKLNADNVSSFIAVAVQQTSGSETQTLRSAIEQKARGNTFAMLCLFLSLIDAKLLLYDKNTMSWFWDDEEIITALHSSNFDRLIEQRLQRVSARALEALKIAACLGAQFEKNLVGLILGEGVDDLINEAFANGIVKLDEDTGELAFANDLVQQHTYRLIPEADRELFHVEIARRLWRKFDSDSLDRYIFVLLSQVNIGYLILSRQKERNALANLCLHAGTKAAKSSTFLTAAIYLNLGIYLLGENCWQEDYDLALALHNAAAEMLLCRTDYDGVERVTNAVLANARTAQHKLQTYATKIYALGVTGRQKEGINMALDVLESFDEGLPRKPSKLNLVANWLLVKKKLKFLSNEQILRFPTMENEQKLACMQILQLIFMHTVFTRIELTPFVALKLVKLTLDYGLSVFASSAFTVYGVVLIAFGDFDKAFRYGELGLELLKQFRAKEFLPRVFAAFYGFIWPWKKTIAGAMDPLLTGYRVGLHTGDIDVSSLCFLVRYFYGIEGGMPLETFEAEFRSFQDTMIATGQESHLMMALAPLQAVHHYMGLSPDPLSSKGDLIDSDQFLKLCEDKGWELPAAAVHVSRMMVTYIFNDYEQAAHHAASLGSLSKIPPTFAIVNAVAIRGMVALAVIRVGQKRLRRIGQIKGDIKRMKSWSRYSPDNCLDRLFLMQAELDSVRKRNAEALVNFKCAVALAKENSHSFMVGLSNERAARHLLALGEKGDAMPFLDQACSAFDAWGAKGKAQRLRTEIESLGETKT